MPVPWPPGEPPWTKDEVTGAQCRPEAQRTPLPQAGERVLFRRREWEDPVPATITSVQDMTVPLCANGSTEFPADVYVWEHPDPAVPVASWTHPRARGELGLRADPWPRVRLELDGGGAETCRESRVRGAPGWLREGEGR
jgi:hypothetical protein